MIQTQPSSDSTQVAAVLATTGMPGRPAVSRLRRGGLLCAAAGLAAATAVGGAQASIVYSGALNQQFNTLFLPRGSYGLQHQTTINIASGQPLTLNVRFSKDGYSMELDSYANSFDPVGAPSGFQLFSGAGGDFIDGNDSYSLASSIQSNNISAGTTAYFGFRFITQGKSAQQLFGWGEFSYVGVGNWVMNGYAYENSGAGILTGDTGVVTAAAVPEPGTVPLVAAAGLVVAFFRRRRAGRKLPG